MSFYVTMFDKRSNVPGDGRFYRIAGPFDTKEIADRWVSPAWKLANASDPRTHFCAFGVSEYENDSFVGPLNTALGLATSIKRRFPDACNESD